MITGPIEQTKGSLESKNHGFTCIFAREYTENLVKNSFTVIVCVLLYFIDLIRQFFLAGTSTQTEKKKEMHVLSLDGGGSRGIMEVIMLGHIMNYATIMTKNPKEAKDSLSTNPELLKKISGREDLGYTPIHPTEAFQYIVGKFANFG